METFFVRVVVASLTLSNILILSVSTPAVTHLHSVRNSGEREKDGAYSPRDKKHHESGEHNVEFDHEAILGEL